MDEPELLILDFDGVVLDSARVKSSGFIELFADLCEDLEAVAAIHARMHGISRFRQFEVVFHDVLGRPITDAESRKLGDRYSEIVRERILACPPIAGAIEFLESHHGRLPIWVASGSPHNDLEQTVRERHLERFFTAVRGTPQTKPETISEALIATDARPQSAVMVGDAISDHDAALEAGLGFVGVVAPDLEDLFPTDTLTVRDLTELETAIRLALRRNSGGSI